tara:strand:+ start:174 stop:317 length:144 start_codon:yes stop_codon:yes gene_type:complete
MMVVLLKLLLGDQILILVVEAVELVLLVILVILLLVQTQVLEEQDHI